MHMQPKIAHNHCNPLCVSNVVILEHNNRKKRTKMDWIVLQTILLFDQWINKHVPQSFLTDVIIVRCAGAIFLYVIKYLHIYHKLHISHICLKEFVTYLQIIYKRSKLPHNSLKINRIKKNRVNFIFFLFIYLNTVYTFIFKSSHIYNVTLDTGQYVIM